MKIRDYDPTQGMAFQGDVCIIPVPEGIAIDTIDEIKPSDGRLILQEGELTGHHHAIDVLDRPTGEIARPRKTSKAIERLLSDAAAGKISLARARLYRDPNAVVEMVRRGVLTRSDLAVGFLIIEPGSEIVVHQEHDGIRIPGGDGSAVQPNLETWPSGYAFQAGRYLIGGQIESVGAEERRVSD